jgi:hypothetical protein
MAAQLPLLRRALLVLVGAAVFAGTLACETEAPPESYVARVGDYYLQEADVQRMLRGMGPVPDSTQARQQVIQQWVEETLLLREAKRLNLSQNEEVQRKLEERRRNTLVSTLTDRFYENTDQPPTDEEVRTYFERYQDQLALREPYVRIRHLTTANEDSAQAARTALLDDPEATADSLWEQLSRRYGEQPRRSRRLADRFLPESRLFAQAPYVRDALDNLQDGEVAPIIEGNDRFHVVQLVRRLPEGTDPELRWVEPEIRRRLRIRHRKQMHARKVERLRNRAKADGLIETP